MTERLTPAGPASTGRELTRRECFRGALRAAAATALAAGAAALTIRGRARHAATRKAGEVCVNSGICRDCGAFDGCGLPQALSARQARTPGRDG